MEKSVTLSPRRRTPATDCWEWDVGVGPCLGTNFLLNEGTLKFGAGGEALRARGSGLEGGELGWVDSVREVKGITCDFGDANKDWRLPWLDVGGLRVYVESLSVDSGSSGTGAPFAVGGELGRFADVKEDARTSDGVVGIVSVQPVDVEEPALESIIDRRFTDTYELLRDCKVCPPTDWPSSSFGMPRF